MTLSIFQAQLKYESEIKKILDEFRDTLEWEISRIAFHEIFRGFVHGAHSSMSVEELDQHFERALTITRSDIEKFRHWTRNVIDSNAHASSPFYLANVTHSRNDQFFSKNEKCPITGTGNKTLNAKFEAHNLYQRFPIHAGSRMPKRLKHSSFHRWKNIESVMTDRPSFDKAFALTHKEQGDEIFELVSGYDWDEVKGELFMAPELAFGSVFSPALFAVFFFGKEQGSPKDVFFIITADGGGKPQKPFIGLVSNPSDSSKKVFDSTNRFAFTYLSSKENLLKYWLEMDEDTTQGFSMGIQTFYPNHPDTPYIEVISDFSAHVPHVDIEFFRKTPFLKTFMMLQKGTLMRDLIKAYYPNDSSLDLWRKVGALKRGHPRLNKKLAKILDEIADLFDIFIWIDKPTES